MFCACRAVWVKGFVNRVVIGCAVEVIADPPRSDGTGDMIFDPVHDLPLIVREIMSFDPAGLGLARCVPNPPAIAGGPAW